MNDFANAFWIELLKARRSKVPWLTAAGFMILPLATGFLMFIYKNPDFARDFGLISAKANLAGGSADWPSLFNMFTQGIAIGGVFLFGLVESWIFGREFSDGTVKDLLAVPISREVILLAKFLVAALWSAALVILVYAASLILGAIIHLPLGSPALFIHSSLAIAVTALLVMLSVTPVALFASLGRGYLLPLGLMVLLIAISNMIALLGWGNYFPWAIPAMYANFDGKGASLEPVSFWIVLLTGLLGMAATYLWWKNADQSR